MSLSDETNGSWRRFAPTALSFVAVAAVAWPTFVQPAAAQAPPAQAAPQTTQKAPAKVPKTKAAAQAETPTEGAGPGAPPKKRDPTEQQRMVEAGVKQLQANKPEPAIQTLTAAITGGLPPPLMAKALHARGGAYRKAAKPAQAISDLTSALWVKGGLSDADRQDAAQQRTEAYREAGLPDQSGDDGKQAGATATTRAQRTTGASGARAPQAPAVTTASLAPSGAQAAPTASTGGLFASLFGGGAVRPAAAAAPAVAAAPPPQAGAVTSGWSSATAVKPSASAASETPAARPRKTASAATTAVAAAGPVPAAVAAVPSAAPASGVHARIALVRNDQEAQAVVQKLKANHAAAVGNKGTSTSQTAFGGMGSFVQVRVGPYASLAEADAFCKQLKGSGLDCVPVDR